MTKILNKKILFTGGGSGGHISAATAIISGLKEKYSNLYEKILYIGSNLSMEGEEDSVSIDIKLVGSTDIPFKAIRAGKLQRYLSFKTIKLLFGVFGGLIDSYKVIKEFKPDLIVSTGGYVTVPICIVGRLFKIPIYIHEQTAGVGMTNKIIGKFADRIYISFKSSQQYFNKNKTLLTGNAVRPAIFNTNGFGESADAVNLMQKERAKYPIILIVGGGQGSHLLNITLRQMIHYLIQDYQIILQTGDNSTYKDFELLLKEKAKIPQQYRTRFHVTKFIFAEEIGTVFNKVDLYIGRSGANFVYEMGVLKIPSIFVPIPWVTNNEQYKNAKTLEDIGLARILPEGELNSDRLNSEIRKFIKIIKNGSLQVDYKKLEEEFPTDAVDKIVADLPL